MNRPFFWIVSHLLFLSQASRALTGSPRTTATGAAVSTSDAAAAGPSTVVVWFRDHALRVRDNDALGAAVEATTTTTTTTTTTLRQNIKHGDEDGGSSILPLYLWSGASGALPFDARTGGTASDVFVAHALDGLNRTLSGKLAMGLVVPAGDNDHEAEPRPHLFADELASVCFRGGASEIYYTESHDKDFEGALRERLVRHHGLVPRPFRFGSCTLLDYSREGDLPWKDIIEEHPFRSPLIPFVDYLLRRLEESPPPPPKAEPEGLEESIAGTDLRCTETGDDRVVVTNPVSVESIRNAVGQTNTAIRTDWGSGIANAWPASERDAAEALELFLDSLPSSSSGRGGGDVGNGDGDLKVAAAAIAKRTHLASRLSPYLARGLLSPRQVYHALMAPPSPGNGNQKNRASFVRRICWRDYTYAVVSLFPDAVTHGRPIREGYYPDPGGHGGAAATEPPPRGRLFRLWKDGATGFPLVDAGMRQLAAEGWMPQKVRLAASTCLVEGLGVSWEEGMRHFAEYLVDHDPAINSNMWMNAGCVGFDPYYVGTDYKRRPYWDKDGGYVRRWCPELEALPDSCEIAEAQRGIGTFAVDCLYEPWSAPKRVLDGAGVVPGDTYPNRCCDEREERKRFFETIRNRRGGWPPSMTDERGRDVVRLGRGAGSESIGMFTPRALLGKPKRRDR